MAILRNDTTVRSADGQSTSPIITAANIGNYGISTTSTYYIGTTQNVFNRASGAQTLTGVSIDGNAANITAYTINQNVGTGNAPSFTGMTSTAMLVASTSMNSVDDWQNSPISIRERGLVAAAQSANTYSPNLNFHWASRISNSLWMDANGNLSWGSYDGTGVPSSDGAFYANNLYASIYFDKNNTVYYLDAANSGTSLLVAGNIGAGLTSPLHKIQATGLISASDATYNNDSTFIGAILNNDGTNPGLDLRRWNGGGAGTNNHGATYIATNSVGDTIFYNGLIAANTRATNEKMRIAVNGNVGMGTTSPSAKLHIYNSTAVDTLLESGTSGTTGKLIFKTSDNADLNKYIMQESYYMILNGHTNEGFKFRDSASNVLLSIFGAANTYASRVGIGTQTPAYKLDVSGAINASTYMYAGVFYDNDNTAFYANPSGASIFNGLKLVSSGNQVSGDDYSLWIQGGNDDWGIGIIKSTANYGITYNLASSHTYGIQGAKNGTEYFRVGTDMLSHDTRLQAPIFYDSNNTAYYLDPNNTGTSLNTAGAVVAGTYVYSTTYLQAGNNNIYPNGFANTLILNAGNSAGNNWIAGISIAQGGNVGIGTTSPSVKLAVDGEASFGDGSKLTMIGLDINSGVTPNFIKIRTKIPFASGAADFTINIKGFRYGSVETTSLMVCWHYYLSTFYNPTISSAGSFAPTVKLSAEDWDSSGTPKVCIVLVSPGYWPKLYVESMYSSAYNDAYADGWDWVDADATGTGNNLAILTYKSNFGNSFVMLSDGNVGIGTISPSQKLHVVGTGFASTDFRSPIFYDSNNTSYYIDAASTSNLNALTVAGGNATIYRDLIINGGASGNFGNRIIVQGTATTYTLQDSNARPTVYLTGQYPVVTLNHTVTNNTNHGPTIQFTFNGLTTGGSTSRQVVIGPDGTGSRLDFGFSGGGYGTNSDYNPHNGIAGYSGITAMRLFSNGLLVGNTGAYPNQITSTSYALDVRGTGYSDTDFRAPIFYDSANTNFYCDPASTSKFNEIWTTDNGNNTTAPRWDTSFYVMQSQHWYSHTGTSTMYVGESGDFVYIRGYSTADGSFRSPIFYDSNNTSYYIDAASTSSLNALTMAGTITGALDATVSFTGGVCTAASYNYILNGANDTGNKLVIFVNGSTRTADGGVNALTIRNDGGAFVLGSGSYLTSILGSSVTINGNAALTSASTLTAGNLSGTIPSGVLGNSTLYVGTTAIALNRGSASQTLTGISIDGNAATATTATNATQLGGVAAANYVRNDVDGSNSTALFRLTTITKSLTITTSWLDTGIVGADLSTGCYMISVYVDNYAVNGGHYQETYTGMMSWFSTGTNSTDYDEIVLHKSGHASNGAYINLRTIRQLSGSTNLKLQIISSVSTNGASNYVFKFRRLI